MNYDTYNLKELRQIPKQRGQKGYSKLPKAKLIAFIEHGDRLGARAPDIKAPTRTPGTTKPRGTVRELREIAKKRGTRGYSRLGKEDLIAFIKHGDLLGARAPDTKVPTRTLGTLRELREIAKQRGQRGYSKLPKAELAAFLSTTW